MANWTPTSTGNGTALGVDYYGRTGWYGTDPVDPANPEIIGADDTEVALNFFGTGIHAYRKWSGGTDAWTDVGVVLLRDAGAFPGGAGAQAEVRLKTQFLLDAINDYSGGQAPLIAVVGEQYGAASAKVILWFALSSGSGATSVWEVWVDYEKYSDGDSTFTSSAFLTYADLAVGTDRDLVLRVQCTSAGQTDFSGILDGFITVTLDGVTLIDEQTIEPYINWQSGNPSVLNSWDRVGLGFAGLLGPIWMVSASDEFTDEEVPPYEPIENVSEPCCSDGTDGAPPATGVTGEIPQVNPYGPHSGISTTTCVGEGTVPTAADLSNPEDWAELLGEAPNISCELIAIKHPSTLGSTTYRWADQGLDLPLESSYVEGRVAKDGWSEIRRVMALPDQYPEASRAGVMIDEQDALLRTLLDTESTSYLKAREWVQWLVSETRRKISGTMAVVFRGVVASLNPSEGRTYLIEADDQITSPFGVFDLNKLLPQAVIDYEFFGPGGDSGTDIHPTRFTQPHDPVLSAGAGQLTRGAHKDLIGTPIPIIAGICSDRGATAIDGQSAEKGAVPLIWTRDCYVPGHADVVCGELLVCLGEVAGIEDVYGSDVGYDGPSPADPPRPAKRININATVGVDLFTPSHLASWPFETPYRERTVNGRTLRYTAIYLRGPRMDDHRRGVCTVTANVCGPMGVNDQVIDQAGPFLQWFYNEHVVKNQGLGYRSGDYHTLETYLSDATVPYVQPTTFDAFQDYTKERLGNDVGYRVVNFQLREQLTLNEIETRFMQDYEVSLPFNRHGQKMLRWIDDMADPTTGTLYREHHEELSEPLPPYVDDHADIENKVGFVCDFDHDLQQWRREPEFLADENSIEAHFGVYQGGQRLSDGQSPQPLEVYSTGDVDTVRDAMARRLMRKRKAPRYQEMTTDLRGLNDEIGDQIRLTHSRGVGATGYQERPFFILEHRLDPNRKMVTLRGMDITALVYGVGVWTDDAADSWDTADATERVANSFWADDDGTIPTDDSPAKEWR